MTTEFTNPAGFIAQDREGLAIFGIGKTEAEAMAEVARECGPFHDEDGRELASDETDKIAAAVERAFVAHPATASLLEQVENMGGNIGWGMFDGITCTVDQEYELEAN